MTAVATTRPMAIKIDQQTRDRIKRIADARHRTPHWVMREAINQFVEREEKRETFRQDAISAWNQFQETGLHVTGDEVIAWLDTWGEENEVTAPVCHE
ncbi:MAG TPA: CopG family ribbon-helix-helix protein [Gallionella sp.]|nr:CopG family ribbon-helix-helix protein [Gallionella sp.]